jgi:signal transduction histidine kinase
MRFFTSVYIILLAYIIAAIVFWELSLQKLNGRIYQQEVLTLKSRIDSTYDPYTYHMEEAKLLDKLSARKMQYIGEGSAFLVVILIGAVVVYTSLHRRIMLSRQQNNFMLSVTHELKSPIAAMKLNMQTMEKRQLSEEQRKMLLDRCIKESNRLNDLCNNMLLASQLEGRQYKQAREVFDISELAEDCLNDYAGRYTRRFEEEITAGCKLNGDKVMLQMAINNLLENAVKYTPEDKPVTLCVAKNPDSITVQVIDQGTGIPDSEKKKVFNKFYRLGNEDSRKTKGTGLGLYLTSKIAHEHKGRITIKDNAPSGCIFELWLPLS